MAGTVQPGHAKGALVIGILEVLCGVLIIILAIVVASIAKVGALFSPWWGGIIFIIPGVLGIIVGVTKNHGVMIAFMVLNIIVFVVQGITSIIIGIAIAIWASIIASVSTNCTKIGNICDCKYDGNTYKFENVDDCDNLSSLLSVVTAITVFLVIAAFISLAGSIMGCIAVCCTQRQAHGGVVMQTQGVVVQQQAPPAYYPQNQTAVKQ